MKLPGSLPPPKRQLDQHLPEAADCLVQGVSAQIHEAGEAVMIDPVDSEPSAEEY